MATVSMGDQVVCEAISFEVIPAASPARLGLRDPDEFELVVPFSALQVSLLPPQLVVREAETLFELQPARSVNVTEGFSIHGFVTGRKPL